MYRTVFSLLILLGLAIAGPVKVVEKPSQTPHIVKHVPIKAVKSYLDKTKIGAKGLVSDFQDVLDNHPEGADVDHHRHTAKGYLPKAIQTIVAMREAADSMLRQIDENGLEAPQMIGGKQDCHQLKKTIDAIKEVAIEHLCSELKRQEIIAFFKSDLNCLLGSVFELWRASERDGSYLTLGYRDIIQTIKNLLVAIETGIRRFSEEINYMDFSNECAHSMDKTPKVIKHTPASKHVESKTPIEEVNKAPKVIKHTPAKHVESKTPSEEGKKENQKKSKDEGEGVIVSGAVKAGEASLVEKVEKVINLEKKELYDIEAAAKKEIEKLGGKGQKVKVGLGGILGALNAGKKWKKEAEKAEAKEGEKKEEEEAKAKKEEEKKEEAKVEKEEEKMNEKEEKKEEKKEEAKVEKEEKKVEKEKNVLTDDKKEEVEKEEKKEEKEEKKEEKEEKKEEAKENEEKTEEKEVEKAKPEEKSPAGHLQPVAAENGTPANRTSGLVDGIDETLKVDLVNEKKDLNAVLQKLDKDNQTTDEETEKVKGEKKEIKKVLVELNKVIADVEAIDVIKKNKSAEREKAGHNHGNVNIIDVITKRPVLSAKLTPKMGAVLPKKETTGVVAQGPIPLTIVKPKLSQQAITRPKTNLKDVVNEEKSLENLRTFGQDALFPQINTQHSKVEQHKAEAIPVNGLIVGDDDIDAQEERDEEERAKEMVEKAKEEKEEKKEQVKESEKEKEEKKAEEEKVAKGKNEMKVKEEDEKKEDEKKEDEKKEDEKKEADNESDVNTEADKESDEKKEADKESDEKKDADKESDEKKDADKESDEKKEADKESDEKKDADKESDEKKEADKESDVKTEADKESDEKKDADKESDEKKEADNESDEKKEEEKKEEEKKEEEKKEEEKKEEVKEEEVKEEQKKEEEKKEEEKKEEVKEEQQKEEEKKEEEKKEEEKKEEVKKEEEKKEEEKKEEEKKEEEKKEEEKKEEEKKEEVKKEEEKKEEVKKEAEEKKEEIKKEEVKKEEVKKEEVKEEQKKEATMAKKPAAKMATTKSTPPPPVPAESKNGTVGGLISRINDEELQVKSLIANLNG